MDPSFENRLKEMESMVHRLVIGGNVTTEEAASMGLSSKAVSLRSKSGIEIVPDFDCRSNGTFQFFLLIGVDFSIQCLNITCTSGKLKV